LAPGWMRAQAASDSGPAAPALWAGLGRGSYAVGFAVAEADSVTVSIWYPARPRGTPLRLNELESAGAGLSSFMEQHGIPRSAAERYAGAPLLARRDAMARRGRFPVILIAQGNQQGAIDQAVLAEYLASHGYVVATTPSPMRRAPMTADSQVGPSAERQARDLEQALAVVGRRPAADLRRVGVLGHSFGARAALLLAMREPRVAALVSLDGGIGTATAMESFRRAPSFDTTRARAPILHFYEELDDFMHPDFALLRSLPARDLVLERVTGMHHIHFATLGFGAATIPEMAVATRADAQEPESLRHVAERTLAYFREYLH